MLRSFLKDVLSLNLNIQIFLAVLDYRRNRKELEQKLIYCPQYKVFKKELI